MQFTQTERPIHIAAGRLALPDLARGLILRLGIDFMTLDLKTFTGYPLC